MRQALLQLILSTIYMYIYIYIYIYVYKINVCTCDFALPGNKCTKAKLTAEEDDLWCSFQVFDTVLSWKSKIKCARIEYIQGNVFFARSNLVLKYHV